MIVAGQVLVPVILWVEMDCAPSLAFQFAVYLPMRVLASLVLLQPIKGVVVALQWLLGLHGFTASQLDEKQI